MTLESGAKRQGAVACKQATQVDAWAVELDQPPDVVERLEPDLTDGERRRVRQIRAPRARMHAVVARSALRRLLGTRLRCAAHDVPIQTGRFGKPVVIGPARDGADPHFNVSHSDGLAIIALAPVPVGIDVERVAPLDRLEQLAESLLAAQEMPTWRRSPDALRAFLRYWTCKEAYLKAVGTGLRGPLTRIAVAFAGVPAFLTLPDDDPARWQVHSFEPQPGYLAALVVEAPAIRVVTHCWQPP